MLERLEADVMRRRRRASVAIWTTSPFEGTRELERSLLCKARRAEHHPSLIKDRRLIPGSRNILNFEALSPRHLFTSSDPHALFPFTLSFLPPIISRTITRKPTQHESHRGRTACLTHSRSPRPLQNISELLDCLCCIESCNDCENNTKNVLLRVLDSTTPHSFRNLNPPAFQLLRGASPFLAIDYVLTLHIPSIINTPHYGLPTPLLIQHKPRGRGYPKDRLIIRSRWTNSSQ